MSAWGDLPRRRPVTMADLEDGTRVCWIEWSAIGTIRKDGARTWVVWDETSEGLDVSPAGPLRPSELELLEPPPGPCCERAVYDDSVGWWCPEHGDQS